MGPAPYIHYSDFLWAPLRFERALNMASQALEIDPMNGNSMHAAGVSPIIRRPNGQSRTHETDLYWFNPQTKKDGPMYRLHGFFTQNSMKPLYVLEELGVDFEFCFVNLMTGANRTDEFRNMTPAGKVPVLEHDGEFLFESGPICRYVSSVEKSPLYPADKLQRARVDQWMTFFTCHPGRWLTSLYFEKIIKPAAGLGETNEANCEEAARFAHLQLGIVDKWLENTGVAGQRCIFHCRALCTGLYGAGPRHRFPAGRASAGHVLVREIGSTRQRGARAGQSAAIHRGGHVTINRKGQSVVLENQQKPFQEFVCSMEFPKYGPPW